MKCSKCRKFICCCCAHEVEDKPKPRPKPTPPPADYARNLTERMGTSDRKPTLDELRDFVERTADFPGDTKVDVYTGSPYSLTTSLTVTRSTEARYQ